MLLAITVLLGPKKNPSLLGVCLCCYVLSCHLIMCLSHAVHGFLTNLHSWSFHFCPTRGCWKVFEELQGKAFFCVLATCAVCQAISAIVHVHVHVLKSFYCIRLSLYNGVHGFLTELQIWSICFCPTRGCWNVYMAFIGTGILYVPATCAVCQAIPAIVHV